MPTKLIMLTIPGLRKRDWRRMSRTAALFVNGTEGAIEHSFPSVTWPAQATMLTGKRPSQHGVIANGFYWRKEHRVEMWTAWNPVILEPQIWDRLHELPEPKTSAAWFPMLSKGSGADYVAMPAPIHKPDGSEELWCYTKPPEYYGELLQKQGHFPLQHFWGPLANIKSSEWIAATAIDTARKFSPDFFYIYLPHLDYAAQKAGPDSPQASTAVEELDQLLERTVVGLQSAFAGCELKWLIVSEYVISPVTHVSFPNRVLREKGFLKVICDEQGRERIDFQNSKAWALVDHQFGHVFVNPSDGATVASVAAAFQGVAGIAQVLSGQAREALGMNHERSGEVLLVSSPESWQAYYWWLDDAQAPTFARTVDIHQKPGYDPVELFFDPTTKSIPLKPELIKGSHGVVTEQTRAESLIVSLGCRQPLPITIPDTAISDFVIEELS